MQEDVSKKFAEFLRDTLKKGTPVHNAVNENWRASSQ